MTTAKPERSAAKSIGLVSLVNIGTTVVGVVQAFVVGGIFGTSSSIEVYFAAVVFYQSIVNLMQTGQIAEVFTPIYHRLKESHGQPTAFRFLSAITNWMVLIALGCSVIVHVFAEYVVPLSVPGFDESRTATCVHMFRWIVPVLALQILAALLSTLLSAEKYFVSQECIRLVCLIASLLLVLFFAEQFDAWVMVGALWLGSLLSLTLSTGLLVHLGYRHSFRLSDSEFSVRDIFKNTPSITSYVGITQIYSIALTAGLSTLPQGSLAVFSYAKRIFVRINGTLMRPIQIVFFNHYSSALAAGDAAVSKLARRALAITLFAAGMAAIAVLSSAYPGMRAIWLSEKYPDEAIFQTYLIISILCVIPFFSGLGGIFRKINMSHQLVQRQYAYLTVIQVISAFMAYYLIPIWGLAGAVVVAVANPVMMTAVSGLLLRTKAASAYCTYRKRDIAKCAIVVAVAVTPSILLQTYLGRSGLMAVSDRWIDFALASVCLASSLLFALVIGLALKVEEFQKAVRFALAHAWPGRGKELEKLR